MHVKVCFPHLLNFVWVWRQKQQAHVIFQPKNISKLIRDIFMSIFFFTNNTRKVWKFVQRSFYLLQSEEKNNICTVSSSQFVVHCLSLFSLEQNILQFWLQFHIPVSAHVCSDSFLCLSEMTIFFIQFVSSYLSIWRRNMNPRSAT